MLELGRGHRLTIAWAAALKQSRIGELTDHDRIVNIHRPGGFSGDVDLIADRPAVVRARARAAGRMLELPLLILWGEKGVVHRCFKPVDEWRRVARDVRGEALPCGHYIAEEAPEALLARVVPFLA